MLLDNDESANIPGDVYPAVLMLPAILMAVQRAIVNVSPHAQKPSHHTSTDHRAHSPSLQPKSHSIPPSKQTMSTITLTPSQPSPRTISPTIRHHDMLIIKLTTARLSPAMPRPPRSMDEEIDEENEADESVQRC